jgi:hypothetical protein
VTGTETMQYGRDLALAIETITIAKAAVKLGHKGLNNIADEMDSRSFGKAKRQLLDNGFTVREVVAPEDYWTNYTPVVRGKKIDEFLGNNLGKEFNIVDKLENRELTSTEQFLCTSSKISSK